MWEAYVHRVRASADGRAVLAARAARGKAYVPVGRLPDEMSRSLELSGRALLVVFEAVSLLALVLFVGPVLWPPEDPTGVALVALFALVVVGLVAALWRSRRVEGSYLRSGYDISYDPVGDPGLAAKERWEKAVRRLPDREDEDESD